MSFNAEPSCDEPGSEGERSEATEEQIDELEGALQWKINGTSHLPPPPFRKTVPCRSNERPP